MKTSTLDKHYPKLEAFGGLRQGTLTFARYCLGIKRTLNRGEHWRLWSFRHPTTGLRWHCIVKRKR